MSRPVIFWQACRRFRTATGQDGIGSTPLWSRSAEATSSRQSGGSTSGAARSRRANAFAAWRLLLFLSPLLLLAAGYGLMSYEDRRALQQVIAELDELEQAGAAKNGNRKSRGPSEEILRLV